MRDVNTSERVRVYFGNPQQHQSIIKNRDEASELLHKLPDEPNAIFTEIDTKEEVS